MLKACRPFILYILWYLFWDAMGWPTSSAWWPLNSSPQMWLWAIWMELWRMWVSSLSTESGNMCIYLLFSGIICSIFTLIVGMGTFVLPYSSHSPLRSFDHLWFVCFFSAWKLALVIMGSIFGGLLLLIAIVGGVLSRRYVLPPLPPHCPLAPHSPSTLS